MCRGKKTEPESTFQYERSGERFLINKAEKGLLNILIFDKKYLVEDVAYWQLDLAHIYPVGSAAKNRHQLLRKTKTIKKQPCYVIFIS
jgi:hypothetical protein